MSDGLDSLGNNKLPSIIVDPFKKNKVTRVSVYSSPGWGKHDDWQSNGVVEFTNGDTKGEQRFQAKTFDEVVLLIKNMLENLE